MAESFGRGMHVLSRSSLERCPKRHLTARSVHRGYREGLAVKQDCRHGPKGPGPRRPAAAARVPRPLLRGLLWLLAGGWTGRGCLFSPDPEPPPGPRRRPTMARGANRRYRGRARPKARDGDVRILRGFWGTSAHSAQCEPVLAGRRNAGVCGGLMGTRISRYGSFGATWEETGAQGYSL